MSCALGILIVGLLVSYYGVSCPDVILVGKELVRNKLWRQFLKKKNLESLISLKCNTSSASREHKHPYKYPYITSNNTQLSYKHRLQSVNVNVLNLKHHHQNTVYLLASIE